MIKTIRTKNIYGVISWLTDITDLVNVFNQKPDEKYIDANLPNDSYLYISKVTDNPWDASIWGFLGKVARFQVTIVSKSSFWAWEDAEAVLMDIVDSINNSICNEECQKIEDRGDVSVFSVIEDVQSPIFYTVKNRPYIVKDYLFYYWGLS